MTAQIITLHRRSFLDDYAPKSAEASARAMDNGDRVARDVEDFGPDEDSPTGPLPVAFFCVAMARIVGVIARLAGAPAGAAAITGWLGGAVVSLMVLWLRYGGEK